MTDRRFIDHLQLDHNGDILKVVCRFCRRKQTHNNQQFVAVCECYAQNQFVHEICLRNWMTHRFQLSYSEQPSKDPRMFNICCEICRCQIKFKFKIIRRCRQYGQLIQRISQKRITFVLLIALFIMSIVGIIFGSYKISVDADPFALYVAIIVTCVFLVFLCIFILIQMFVFTKSIKIQSILNRSKSRMMKSMPNMNSERRTSSSKKQKQQRDRRKNIAQKDIVNKVIFEQRQLQYNENQIYKVSDIKSQSIIKQKQNIELVEVEYKYTAEDTTKNTTPKKY